MAMFRHIPQFTRTANYQVDISWNYLLEALRGYIGEDGLDIDPDFQRAHVWDEEKQTRYVEFILRGGDSGKDIYTNCPRWHNGGTKEFVLVDGKQRLQAVTKFLRDELTIFGAHRYKDYTDSLRITQASFKWHVNDLDTRAEVLQWYLDLNDGGVVHTSEELGRVRTLLAQEKK